MLVAFNQAPFGGPAIEVPDSSETVGPQFASVTARTVTESPQEVAGAQKVVADAIQPSSTGAAQASPGALQVSVSALLGPEAPDEAVGAQSVSVAARSVTEFLIEAVGAEPASVSVVSPGEAINELVGRELVSVSPLTLTEAITEAVGSEMVDVLGVQPASTGAATETVNDLVVLVRGFARQEWPVWLRPLWKEGFTQVAVATPYTQADVAQSHNEVTVDG